MDLAIIIFGYSRPRKLEILLENISEQNKKCFEIFVFIDKHDDTKIHGSHESLSRKFKDVQFEFRTKKYGLAKNVSSGISQVLEIFEACIVLEDDLILHDDCIDFLETALKKFKNHKDIGQINGYSDKVHKIKNPTYEYNITDFPTSWGWATWRDRWHNFTMEPEVLKQYAEENEVKAKLAEKIKWGSKTRLELLELLFESRIDSWAICWTTCLLKAKLKCIEGSGSYVENAGFVNGSHVAIRSELRSKIRMLLSYIYKLRNR